MADFLSNLWTSIFTPGTTPTLLVATNATFGALQLLLFTLLLATYSIHFAILSALCGGLWWSVNWFAGELAAAQAKEDEAEKLRKRKKGEERRGGHGSADDEGEDTEVEEAGRSEKPSKREVREGGGQGQGQSSGVSSRSGQNAEARRRAEEMERSGEISTDSEWEKISHDGDR